MVLRIIIFVAFLAALIVPRLLRGEREKTIKQNVYSLSSEYSSSNSLDYVFCAQRHNSIHPSCKLDSFEGSFARKIIEEIFSDVSKAFMSDRIEPTKHMARLSREEFFFLCLYDHLWRLNDDRICGKKLYSGRNEFTDPNGSTSYAYDLTDEGLIYYKLLYISGSYCFSRPHVNTVSLGLMIGKYTLDYYQKTITEGRMIDYK